MGTGEAPDELTDDIGEIRAFLAEQPLEFALLFGSQVTGTATERSDFDFVVKFSETLDTDERFQRRNHIAGELMARLGTDDVDVSDLEHLPTEIAHAALQEGILLVGGEDTVDQYRQQVTEEYEQTAADRKRAREELLRRLQQGTYGQ